MIAQEAIKAIETVKTMVEWEAPIDYQIAFDMAIKALEKQVPVKPKDLTDYSGSCPNCGEVVKEVGSIKTDYFEQVTNYSYNFCPNCGQAIDWSDVEE